MYPVHVAYDHMGKLQKLRGSGYGSARLDSLVGASLEPSSTVDSTEPGLSDGVLPVTIWKAVIEICLEKG